MGIASVYVPTCMYTEYMKQIIIAILLFIALLMINAYLS